MTTAHETSPAVTVIGLGAMGSALAGVFTEAGNSTTVWNRTPGKADELVASGATEAATAAEAAAASPLVVVCLFDYPAVREVLEADGVAEALAGRVLVNLTSGTTAQARETAAWAAERGIAYVDGAIMTIPPLIGTPDVDLFYAGSQRAFAAHEVTLARLGKATFFGEDAGLALLYDLALLGMLWSTYGGFLHAVALVGTEGVTAEAFLPHATSWLSGIASFMPYDVEEIDKRDYATEISSLQVNATGIEHLIEVSRAQGIGVDVMAPLHALMQRGIAEGRGGESLSSLVELIRRPGAGDAEPAGAATAGAAA